MTRALPAILAGLVLSTAVLAQGDIAVKTDSKLNALLPAAVRARGVLKAATSASVPPLLYVEPGTGRIVGAVADLTHAYAARLGIRVDIVKTGGEAVIPGVLARRYDLVAAMGDMVARRERIDFVDIVKGGNALITRKGNPAKIAGIDDLCGRKLAVGKGSIQEQRARAMSDACVKAGKAAIQVMGYSDGPTSMLALQSGRADVHWDDIASALYKVRTSPDAFEIVGAPQDKDAPYGIGFPKDQPQLRDAVHAALASLHKDGTYARILDKWGVAEIALPAIVINGSKY